MKVREVMGGPSGEELAERNRTEIGVAAAAVKVAGFQLHGAESGKAFRANGGKFVEQLRQRFALRFFVLPFAIERFESLAIRRAPGSWRRGESSRYARHG